ncbi:MAG: hypothetical protein ACLFWL_14750, partial [Candidatus Brocadiia bacterium]
MVRRTGRFFPAVLAVFGVVILIAGAEAGGEDNTSTITVPPKYMREGDPTLFGCVDKTARMVGLGVDPKDNPIPRNERAGKLQVRWSCSSGPKVTCGVNPTRGMTTTLSATSSVRGGYTITVKAELLWPAKEQYGPGDQTETVTRDITYYALEPQLSWTDKADPASLHNNKGKQADGKFVSGSGQVSFELTWKPRDVVPPGAEIAWKVNGQAAGPAGDPKSYEWTVPEVTRKQRSVAFRISCTVTCGGERIFRDRAKFIVYALCTITGSCQELARSGLLGKVRPLSESNWCSGHICHGGYNPKTGNWCYRRGGSPAVLQSVGENVAVEPSAVRTSIGRTETRWSDEIVPLEGGKMEVYLDRIGQARIYEPAPGGGYEIPQEGQQDPTSPWNATLQKVQTPEGNTEFVLTHQRYGWVRRFEKYQKFQDGAYRLKRAELREWNYRASVRPRFVSERSAEVREATITGRHLYTFGRNLIINYADFLWEYPDTGTVHLTLAGVSQTGVFEKTEDGYELTDRTRSDVWDGAHLEKKADGHFVYSQADGTRRIFGLRNSSKHIQRIARREDSYGNAITFTYDSATGALTAIRDASGSRYEFLYNAQRYVRKVRIPPISATWTYSYTAAGRLESETDSRTGKTINYLYDAGGGYIGQSDTWGDHSITYDDQSGRHTYESPTSDFSGCELEKSDATGSIARSTDRAGNLVKVKYDKQKRQRTVIFQDGTKRLDRYDKEGRLIEQEHLNPDGPDRHKSYTYDENDYMASETIDPGGLDLTTRYVRDDAGRVLRRTDPEGNTTTYTYDADGNITSRTDPEGNTTTYSYNSKGQRTSRTDPMGNTWTYSYDDNGNRTSTTDPEGNTTQHEYDAYGNRTATIDPLGNRTEYEYDAEGNMVKKTDPLGNETTYEYNDRDLRTKVTNPRGVVTEMTYDERGNVTEVEGDAGESGCGSCGGASTPMEEGTYTYDDMGNLTSFTDVMGRTTEYEYDSRGNRTKTIKDPAGEAWTTTREYDALGRVIKETDSRGGVTEYEYDAAGRRIRTKVHTGENTVATTERSYDGNGRVTAVTDPLGNTTTRSYNKNGQLTAATDPLGNTTSRSYDAAGNLTSTTDPLGNTTTYSYDDAGNMTGTTDPEGNTVQYEYDAAGRRTAETDKNGETTTFSYDETGRMIEQTDPRDNTTGYEYDEVGNRTKVTDADGGSTFYEYTAGNRVNKVIDAHGNVTTYTRNEDGSVAEVTDPKDRTTSYEYDVLGRRVKTTAPDGSVTKKKLDGEGNLL